MIKLHQIGCSEEFSPKFTTHLFSGGEPHVTLQNPGSLYGAVVWIEAHISSMVDFGYMMALAYALQGARVSRCGIYLPYFPGARQDHPAPGTPFTVKMYSDILDTIESDWLVTVDPHSAVVQALQPDIEVITAAEIIGGDRIRKYNGVICPDAGAEKRASAVAQLVGLPLTVGRKARNLVDGKLLNYEVQKLFAGRYLVVDDICDGGATFVALAKAVGSGPILDLYVTHGIFSKGFSDLNKYYESIITTNSFPFIGEPPYHMQTINTTPIAQRMMERAL